MNGLGLSSSKHKVVSPRGVEDINTHNLFDLKLPFMYAIDDDYMTNSEVQWIGLG